MSKTSITQIIDLLKVDNFYFESENIDIAKGKHQLPHDWKGVIKNMKRNKKY